MDLLFVLKERLIPIRDEAGFITPGTLILKLECVLPLTCGEEAVF